MRRARGRPRSSQEGPASGALSGRMGHPARTGSVLRACRCAGTRRTPEAAGSPSPADRATLTRGRAGAIRSGTGLMHPVRCVAPPCGCDRVDSTSDGWKVKPLSFRTDPGVLGSGPVPNPHPRQERDTGANVEFPLRPLPARVPRSRCLIRTGVHHLAVADVHHPRAAAPPA